MFILASINAQGLRSVDRRRAAFSFFKRKHFDIILVQETHWTDDIRQDIERDWGGEIVMSCGDNHSRGVAILFRPHLDYTIDHRHTDNNGRIATTIFTIDETTFNLIAIYAPRTDAERAAFFSEFAPLFSPTHPNILGGDFNCISNAKMDKRGGNPLARQAAITTLGTSIVNHNLVDIWRTQHPHTHAFTWTGKNPTDNSPILTRIDRFYIAHAISHLAVNSDIKPYPHSDHDLISLQLDLSRTPRGKGYWHFNNTLLANASFNTDLIAFWQRWLTKKADFDNILTWWDKAKFHFKQIAIHHTSKARKIANAQRHAIERNIEYLKSKAATGDQLHVERYLTAKQKLRQLELAELDAIKIRTKPRFSEVDERSSKYFYTLEKARQADQSIKLLTKDNLDTISDPYDILVEARTFYQKLYTAEPIDEAAQRVVLSINTPTLTPRDRKTCEGLITRAEITQSVKDMEPNKSPGIDGLTVNFYQHFWDILAPELTAVYNYAYTSGLLSLSQRRGVITLVFKKGDRTRLSQWRPISLLTTDYKILTKALARRLTSVLHKIIHTNQTACIPTRTINDNVSLLRDAITYANDTNTPLAFISIDQLKAFDRVSHSFLFKSLAKFGFGPQFIRWIKLIYKQVTSSVKTNGWLSAFITLERGLRQGCPLSAPLYIITAELMATHIRANPNIHGLTPPNSNEETKLSQYADDTSFLLTDVSSIRHAFDTLALYERASGARVNNSKCKGLWAGAFKHRTDQFLGFDWFNDYIPEKILGLYFGNIDCTRLNLQPRITKITNTITAWSNRDLSFKGKTLVINGLLTSVLWYHATALPIPAWAVRDIEQSIYSFFWSNKMPLVKRDTLALPRDEGGFNVHRIGPKITALRLSTLRRYLDPEQASWKHFVTHYLRVAGQQLGPLTLSTHFKPQHIDQSVPTIHRELLLAWAKLYPHITQNFTPSLPNILFEPLFLNPRMTSHGQTLLYRHWPASGVTQVRDLCYVAIPGFLPATAVCDLIPNYPRQQLLRELRTIMTAIPDAWKRLILFQSAPNTAPSPVSFSLNTPLTPLANVPTRTFYRLLTASPTLSVPSLDYWSRTLQPAPTFNATFWKSLYCPLLPNKFGDLTWKVAHRVLPTALSLFRINAYPSADCHHCSATETIDHLILHCPNLRPFWSTVGQYVSDISDATIPLTDQIILFGLQLRKSNVHSRSKIHLINFLLHIARYAIHKSAVEHRLNNVTLTVQTIFKATVKHFISHDYQLQKAKGTQYLFPFTWCINNTIVSVVNDRLQFHL